MAALNNRITVRRQVSAQDTAGQPEVIWQDVDTVWADIHFESGNAAIRGDKQITAVRASVKVWARSDFAAGMQVQQQGRDLKLHVSAVLPDERDRKFMYLVCEATR